MKALLGPLTRKALRDRRNVMLNYREPGMYEASLSEALGWIVAEAHSVEAALGMLEIRLRQRKAAEAKP